MTMQERPTSLREVLDAGCDLTSTGLWLEGLGGWCESRGW